MAKNNYRWVYWMVGILWLLYAGFGMFSPLGENQFELSRSMSYFLRLTIYLPYLIVWAAAVWAAVRLSVYSEEIRDSRDGIALSSITSGIFVLLAGMLIPSLVGVVRSYYPDAFDLIRAITIFTNYCYVVFPLIGFWLIWRGGHALASHARGSKTYAPPATLAVTLTVGLLAALMSGLIFTNPNRQWAPEGFMPTYYISDWMVVVTLLIPQLIAWTFGLLAAADIAGYMRHVQGSIYRQFLRNVSWGLVIVIAASILLQGIVGLGGERLIGLGLGPLLLVIYIWLAGLVVGYIFVARGIARLQKIEEVEISDGKSI